MRCARVTSLLPKKLSPKVQTKRFFFVGAVVPRRIVTL
jgi:hypothetical protein